MDQRQTTLFRYIKVLICSILLLFTSISSQAFVVVLDPGHGGKDPGALGTYSKEKNINLNVVLKLRSLIQNSYPEVKVICTRTYDTFLELSERAEVANKAKADLFISVHTNSTTTNTAVGAETYILAARGAAKNLEIMKRENDAIRYEANQMQYAKLKNPLVYEVMQDVNLKHSNEFATAIQNEYAAIGRVNRQVQSDNFYVLRMTKMVSVLTELGYISTPSEEAYLNSEKGINEMAQALFRAFRTFYSPTMRRTLTTTQTQEEQVKPTQPKQQQPVAKPQAKPQQQQQAKQQPAVKPQAKQQPAKTQNTQAKDQKPAIKPQANDKTKAQANNKPAQQPKKQQEFKHHFSGQTYTFKIQISSLGRLYPDNQLASTFKGLTPIDVYKETDDNNNNTYRYFYGAFKSWKEANEALKKVKTLDKNFAGAFIVAFDKSDKTISVPEARKQQP